MEGVYCIFDLEPNKEFNFGILRVSWLICKFEKNNITTLMTKDFLINQDNNPKFVNYNYKYHGISNGQLKLDGEDLLYVLDIFRNDLKIHNVNYISGFKIRNQDIKEINKYAMKFDLIELMEENLTKNYIIMDIINIIGKWSLKRGVKVKLNYDDIYHCLFKKKCPHGKYHNTLTECENTRSIIFNLMIQDPELFDDYKPLFENHMKLKSKDHLKNIADEKIMEENDLLNKKIIELEKTILKLEVSLEKTKEKVEEEKIKYFEFRDNKVKLEAINQELRRRLEIIDNITKIEKMNKELQEKVKLKETKNMELNNEKTEMEKMNKELNEKIKDEETKLLKMRDMKIFSDSKNKDLEKKLKIKESKVLELKNDKIQMECTNQELLEKISLEKAKILEIKNEKTQVEKINKKLQEEIKNEKKQVNKINKTLQEEIKKKKKKTKTINKEVQINIEKINKEVQINIENKNKKVENNLEDENKELQKQVIDINNKFEKHKEISNFIINQLKEKVKKLDK